MTQSLEELINLFYWLVSHKNEDPIDIKSLVSCIWSVRASAIYSVQLQGKNSQIELNLEMPPSKNLLYAIW